MNDELTKQLLDKYPDLFEEHWLGKERKAKHFELSDRFAKARKEDNKEELEKVAKEREEIGCYHSIAYGFECNDGWYDLIDELCAKITELDKEKVVKAVQVKEKFGGLRFYIYGSFVIDFLGQASLEMKDDSEQQPPKDVHDLIHEYQNRSYSICEVCGKPGQICQTQSRWYKTVCKEHRELETWAGHKQIYLPCYRFTPEQDVVRIEHKDILQVEKLDFDVERDEWKYTLSDGNVYYKDQLKRIPSRDLYEGWIVKYSEIPEREFSITHAEYNPAEDAWLYDIETLGCDEHLSVAYCKADQLEYLTDENKRIRSVPKKQEESCQLSDDKYFEAINGKEE